MFTHATCSTTFLWVTVQKSATSLNKVEHGLAVVISACICARALSVFSAAVAGPRLRECL